MNKKLYTNQQWYINNYNSLGSNWLIKSLDEMQLPKDYVLINLSANAGYYEKDAYLSHKEKYTPHYYIGDLCASKLTDGHVESFENFIYLPGDNDASEISEALLPEKADVILDNKGALWHYLDERTKDDVLRLINKYISLLKNHDSYLLLDCYETSGIIQRIRYFFKWKLKYNHKSGVKVDNFGEVSTYTKLNIQIGRKKLKKYIRILEIASKNDKYQLAEKMNTMVITKDNLFQLRDEFDGCSRWLFKLRRDPVNYILWHFIIPAVMLANIIMLLMGF